MALKFLVDECMTLRLVDLAHARGYEAYHVVHRGLAGAQDHQLLPLLLAEELVFVTNNGSDFTPVLGRAGSVHPGLVVLVTQVPRRLQRALFSAVLDHLGAREELINRAIEVDVDDDMKRVVSRTERLPEEVWQRIEADLRPVIREYDLPPATDG